MEAKLVTLSTSPLNFTFGDESDEASADDRGRVADECEIHHSVDVITLYGAMVMKLTMLVLMTVMVM